MRHAHTATATQAADSDTGDFESSAVKRYRRRLWVSTCRHDSPEHGRDATVLLQLLPRHVQRRQHVHGPARRLYCVHEVGVCAPDLHTTTSNTTATVSRRGATGALCVPDTGIVCGWMVGQSLVVSPPPPWHRGTSQRPAASQPPPCRPPCARTGTRRTPCRRPRARPSQRRSAQRPPLQE